MLELRGHIGAIRNTGIGAARTSASAVAIESVKARDGIIDSKLETRRLQLAIDTVINSADARAEGFGAANAGRLALMASQVSDAFATKTRVDPATVWNASLLPPAAELAILKK